MKLNTSVVGSYFRKKPSTRIEILYDNYESFPRLIICCEKNLKLMIMTEKARIRSTHRGELGVRIQDGGKLSSPVEKEVVDNDMVDRAIANEDFSDLFFKDLSVMEEIYDGITEIGIMRTEYDSFSSIVDALSEPEKKFFIPYLMGEKGRGDLADEFGLPIDTVDSRLKRLKKRIKENMIGNMADYNN